MRRGLATNYKRAEAIRKSEWYENPIGPSSWIRTLNGKMDPYEIKRQHLLNMIDVQDKVKFYLINGKLYHSICEITDRYGKLSKTEKNLNEIF